MNGRYDSCKVYEPSPGRDNFGDTTGGAPGMGPFLGELKKIRFAWGGYMEAGYRTPNRVDQNVSLTTVTIFADKRETPLIKKGHRLVVERDGKKRIYSVVGDRDWELRNAFTGTDFRRYSVQAELVL